MNRKIATRFTRYLCLVNFDQAEITRYNHSKTWKITKKCVGGCILSHMFPINAKLEDSVSSCWICWSCIDFIPYYMDSYPVPMVWNLALSRIFDPILGVFDFPSQKTFAAFFLYFLKKIYVGRISYKGFQGPSCTSPPQNFYSFQPPPPSIRLYSGHLSQI